MTSSPHPQLHHKSNDGHSSASLSGELQAWTGQHHRLSIPQSYLYSYPHKTAYRESRDPHVIRGALWRDEPAEILFLLYAYSRSAAHAAASATCSRCPTNEPNVHAEYVDALERQARSSGLHSQPSQAPCALRHRRRDANAAGTAPAQPAVLHRDGYHGPRSCTASISVETSPETLTEEKLSIS
jgi:oxygen-independent coproporphyrinogen-3 oxidase